MKNVFAYQILVFENKGMMNNYSYFDVDKKSSSINFKNFYKQLKTHGFIWKTIHHNYKVQLSNDEKFIAKAYSWRKINFGIKVLYENYNTFFILNNAKIYKSVNWTDLYQYGIIGKHRAPTKYFSILMRKI